jgi:hypothetical protein
MLGPVTVGLMGMNRRSQDFAGRPGRPVACATAVLDPRARGAGTLARITACAACARHRSTTGSGPNRPRACIQREVFGERVVVMAPSDHSDPRAVPVYSERAGLAALRLGRPPHQARRRARADAESPPPGPAPTANISTHHADGRFERCDARARLPRWPRPRKWPIGETARDLGVQRGTCALIWKAPCQVGRVKRCQRPSPVDTASVTGYPGWL